MQLRIIASPTERTPAVTDAVLAALAGADAIHLFQLESLYSWKANLWPWIFTLLAAAALLGSIVHGFRLAKRTQLWLWHPLYVEQP